MKSLYTVIFTLFSVFAFGQEEELEFMQVDGNNITWQKVYASVLTPEQMKEKFMELNLFENVDSDKPERIVGNSIDIENDFLANGYSEKTAPKYLVSKDLMGTLIVDFNEGKYRVTLKNIQLKQRYGTKKSPKGSVNRLMEYAYNGKKMRWEPDFVIGGGAKIVNQTLLNTFKIGGQFDGSDF